MLEARPYLDATPLDGSVGVASSALLCLNDGEWTCVELGPLGEGALALAPWSPGVWILGERGFERVEACPSRVEIAGNAT